MDAISAPVSSMMQPVIFAGVPSLLSALKAILCITPSGRLPPSGKNETSNAPPSPLERGDVFPLPVSPPPTPPAGERKAPPLEQGC